jgi:hypothetical protein
MSRGRPARERGVIGRAVRASLAVVVTTALALAAGQANAYVRYKTDKGLPFYWPQSWVPATAYPLSMTDANGAMQMTPEQIMHAATAASDAWSSRSNACTYVQINVTESDSAAPQARYDYRNSIIFRTTSWCAPTDPAGMCSYAPEALAITSVFVDRSNGEIKDGDIEVNAKNFDWADLDITPSTIKQDLQNALTHEMGHLIGLDHTCYDASSGIAAPLDNTGKPVPDCNNAPADVAATTMFASATPGDTAKRTLAPDDIQGVCDIYPVADDPKQYLLVDEPPDQSACKCDLVDGRPRRRSTILTAAGLLVILAFRRRHARSG